MKLNHSSILATLLVATLLPAQICAAKQGEPPPLPVAAGDVDCEGCVDSVDISDGTVTTVDINDGAVTTEKLSTSLQQQINQLTNQTMVARDANGVTFGKVVHMPNWYSARVIYQWQGYDLMLRLSRPGLSPSAEGIKVANLYHTEPDCSDVPWVDAGIFDNSNKATITGDAFETVTSINEFDFGTFKIIGPANPSQIPINIIAVARSFAGTSVCTGLSPSNRENMIQGFVELTPGFGADHPPPYTVIVQ